MPHMVIFRDAEGKPGYHHADLLDDAVRFVEHLRNEQHVSDTRVFAMQEVPIEFKTYYRVEVSTPVTDEAPADAPEFEEDDVDDDLVDDEPEAEVDAEPVMSMAGPADVAQSYEPVAPASPPASSRFGLFGRN